MSQSKQENRDFDRLRRTPTFRRNRLARWRAAKLGVFGAGTLGGRFAIEASLSGACVRVFDFGRGSPENRATQFVEVGVAKAESVAAKCNAVRAGSAVARCVDIRHVGVGELQSCDVLVDCTDDPTLAVPLVKISNGLKRPLLRLAVDGTGESDLGRVLCSHGGAGQACAVCTYSREDIFRHTQRTPCPGANRDLPPTLAGGPVAAVVAGYGLLQAQRLVTGNDVEHVIGREIILDMSHGQTLSIQRKRCAECLSGHQAWSLAQLSATAGQVSFADLFAEAQRRCGAGDIVLQPHGHPLCVEASCDCGRCVRVVGTRFATPPACSACQLPMHWFRQTAHARITRDVARHLQIENTPVASLGLPASGAMFTALAQRRSDSPLQLVLA